MFKTNENSQISILESVLALFDVKWPVVNREVSEEEFGHLGPTGSLVYELASFNCFFLPR